MANIKYRSGLRLYDALYDNDLAYASYLIRGSSKLIQWSERNRGRVCKRSE
jgi:hypothetical protein